MLSNGMGGLDWSGLPTVAALLGIEDIESFVRHLMAIKQYRPDRADPSTPQGDTP